MKLSAFAHFYTPSLISPGNFGEIFRGSWLDSMPFKTLASKLISCAPPTPTSRLTPPHRRHHHRASVAPIPANLSFHATLWSPSLSLFLPPPSSSSSSPPSMPSKTGYVVIAKRPCALATSPQHPLWSFNPLSVVARKKALKEKNSLFLLLSPLECIYLVFCALLRITI